MLKRYVNGTEETAVIFNNTGQCKGTLQSETTGSDYQKSYVYDNTCRPIRVTTNIGGNSYTMETQYDGAFGRVKAVVYPNDLTLANLYNNRGYLTTVKNAKSDYIYRKITDADVRGQYTQAEEGNGIINKAVSYDPVTGQMLTIGASSVSGGNQRHRIAYHYDNFGNLLTQEVETREGAGIDVVSTETYLYDNLQRLIQSSLDINNGADKGTSSINYNYDKVGNFTLKSDYISTYSYGDMAKSTQNAGPNAAHYVTKSDGTSATYQYDLNGNMEEGDGKTLTYNAFNKPVTVTRADITSTFSYGADLSRYRQVKTGIPGGTETTTYIGKAYEEIVQGTTKTMKAYIGDIAVVTETIGGPTPGHSIGFIHRDRLGSVITITDENGNVVDNKSYDPFGKPRKGNQKPLDSLINPTLKEVVAQSNLINGTNYSLYTNRGFTDHEHLDDAQLIHMNGRVYDYNLGRFLSVDPIIQAPGNSQSMNPYSYIMNNPLAGTDPSGYCSTSDTAKSCAKDLETGKPQDIFSTPTGSHIKRKVGTITKNKDGTVTVSKGNGKGKESSQTFSKGVLSGTAKEGSVTTNIAKSLASRETKIEGVPANEGNHSSNSTSGESGVVAAGTAITADGFGNNLDSEVVKQGVKTTASGAAKAVSGLAKVGVAFSILLHSTGLNSGEDKYLEKIIEASKAGIQAAKEQIRKSSSNRRAVIGETQSKVDKAALALQAITINFPKNFKFVRPLTALEKQISLAFNAAWINTLIDYKFDIYDIGLDKSRIERSTWYATEKSILKIRKYPTIEISLGD